MLQDLLDDDGLLGVPLLVLANKQDAPTAIPADEIEELMHLGSIRDRTWSCFGCSALRGSGLVEGMKWLADSPAGTGGRTPRSTVPSLKAVFSLAKFRSKSDHAPPKLARSASSAGASRRSVTGSRARDDDDAAASEDDDNASAPSSPARSGSRRGLSLRRGRSTRGAAAASSDDDDEVAAPPPAAAPAGESTTGTARRTRTARARRQQQAPATNDEASSDEN